MVNLVAVVVEVVFAHHLGAGEGEDARERIAHSSPASATNVDGTGRVGGDVFEVHSVPRARLRLSVILARGKDSASKLTRSTRGETNVNETGSGYFSRINSINDGEARHQKFRQVTGRSASALGQLHGHIGGPITMVAVTRALDLDFGEVAFKGDGTVGHRGCKLGGNYLAEFFWSHGSDSTLPGASPPNCVQV